MQLQTKPVIPLPPDAKFYPTSALNTFQTYNRATLAKAQGGEQAAAFDDSNPAKGWADTSADPNQPYVFKSLSTDKDGYPIIADHTIPGAQAGKFNLPGAVIYPPYIIEDTPAIRGGSGINPRYLCLKSDAQTIMDELSAFGTVTSVLLDVGGEGFFKIDYNGDLRRWWYFKYKSKNPDAPLDPIVIYPALLIEQKYEPHGIGAPGAWDGSGTGEPIWIPAPPAPTGYNTTKPLVTTPTPMRDLIPGIERLNVGSWGLGSIVERLDM